MRRLVRVVCWLSAIVALALAVAIGGLLYWAQTDSSRTWLATNLADLLSEVLAGEIRIERVGGSLWRDIELTGVSVRYEDKDVLTVPALRARFRLDPVNLLRLRIQIAEITIDAPTIAMTIDDDGAIDLVDAFMPVEDDETEIDPDEAPLDLVLLFDRITITAGTLRFAGLLDEPLGLTGFDASASIGVWPEGVDVALDSLAGQLAVPGLPELSLQTELRFDDRTPPATIAIGPLTLNTAASSFGIHALLRDARGDFSNLHIDARLDVTRLAHADLVAIAGELPFAVDVDGSLSVHGDLDVLHLDGTLNLGSEALTLGGRLDLGANQPRFNAAVRADGFALAAVTGEFGIDGTLSGSVHAAGLLADPERIEANAELEIRDLAVEGRELGRVRIEGRKHQTAVTLNTELSGPAGTVGAYARGVIDTSPSFMADLFLDNFDAGALGSGTPKTAANLVARIEGSATDAGTFDAETVVYVGPSEVAGVPIDTGVVRSRLQGDSLQIGEARFASGGSRLTLAGHVDLSEHTPSELALSLDVPRLEFAATRTQIGGGGRLSAEAQLSGPVSTPHLRANATVDALAAGSVEFRRADVTLDAAIDADGLASGTLALRIDDVREPTALDNVVVQLDLQPESGAQGLRLALDADDPDLGTHTTRLSGAIATERATIEIESLRVGSTLGEWRLAAPATLTATERETTVTPLRVASEHGSIEARAALPAKGEIDVAVRVDGIDIGFLTKGALRNARLGGVFTAAVDGAGTVAAPDLRLRAAIEDIQVAGESRGRFTAVGQLTDSELTVDARVEQDAEHWLDANASLPIEIPEGTPLAARVSGPLAARVDSPGLRLDVFRAFTGRDVRNLDGKLALAVAIDGPLDEPDVVGEIQLTDGTVRLQPLGVTIEGFTLRAAHEPGLLRISELQATANRGRLSGGGEVTLDGYLPETFDLRIEASRWPAIRTDRYQAEIGGDMRLSGTLDAPEVGGKVIVESAYLRPDLRFLESSAGPAERDPTIVVIDSARPSFEPDPVAGEPEAAGLLPERIRADVTLEIRRGTRVRHEMADIELSGRLRARIAPGGAPVVTGQVETVRGWIQIQGREFQLERGTVTFSGGPVENPGLDIVARHRRSPYVVRAAIGGTVEEPTLTLSSEPALDQADILAVLLFGRPLATLDEGEKTTLQQQALSVTSGYAAGVLGEAVSDALGLDSLGIDLRDVDFTGGRVSVGRYLTPNTYVSVTQDLTEQRGRTVSVEYFLTPSWKILTSTDSLGASGVDVIWQTLY